MTDTGCLFCNIIFQAKVKTMTRKIKTYIPIMLILIALGLPSRLSIPNLPHWYVAYTGDFLWAMLVFFFFCLIFNLKNKNTFILTIATTYLIEFTQLFRPAWLETLRSYKIIALIIGYTFVWSDIIAYSLGISLAAIINHIIISKKYN